MSEANSDDSIPRELIEEEAEANDVPVNLLLDLYELEQELITVEHRSQISSRIRDIVEKYGPDEKEVE